MADEAHRVTLGRIVGVYGIKGWVKLLSFTRPLDGILKYAPWTLSPPGGAPGEGAALAVRLVEGRAHAGGVVAQLAIGDGPAVEDRDVAARWLGFEISVPREALPKAKRGEIYWVDLIGMAVESSEGVALGVVADVTSNGAQDVLVVRQEAVAGDSEGSGGVAAVQRLIPFVRGPVIAAVDEARRLITAHWQPEW